MSDKLNRRGFMEAIVAAVGGASGASVGSKISHNSQEEQIDWKARYEKGHQEWRESIAAKDAHIHGLVECITRHEAMIDELHEEIVALECQLYAPYPVDDPCDMPYLPRANNVTIAPEAWQHRPFRGMYEIMLPWMRYPSVEEADHDDSS